jgi:amidase
VTQTELTHLSASAIAEGVSRRKFTARAVLESHLAAIDRFNPVVNAICTLAADRAMADAESLDVRLAGGAEPPILAGVPVAIKDIVPTAGIRTTWGSPLFADFIPTQDALIVERLRQAGAIVLGKTNVPEFAAGANTTNRVFGATRNPWNLDLTAGGSSGGAAAALASGMIALADGSDLGGSIRTPAAFCGVVGLRPTPGLVPIWPTERPLDTLAVAGPMGRSVSDVALMLTAIAGNTPKSPLTAPTTGRDFRNSARGQNARELRMAWCADPVGIGIDREIETALQSAARLLAEAGNRIDEIALDFSETRDIFFSLRAHGMVANHLDRLMSLEKLDPKIAWNIQAGLDQDPRDLATAERKRARFRERIRLLFEQYDVLLCPATSILPFPVGVEFPEIVNGRAMRNYVEWLAPTFPATLAGVPALAVSCGTSAGRLPIGLQIITPAYHEERALAVGALIETAHPFAFPVLPA